MWTNHAGLSVRVCGEAGGVAFPGRKLADPARVDGLPRPEFARPVGKFRALHPLKLMAGGER
jgi:hypothetical protein